MTLSEMRDDLKQWSQSHPALAYMISTADMAALLERINTAETRLKTLEAILAEINNTKRHQFHAAVVKAADELFGCLAWSVVCSEITQRSSENRND